MRSTDVETLLGKPAKARLGWTHRISFDDLLAEIVREDIKSAERGEGICLSLHLASQNKSSRPYRVTHSGVKTIPWFSKPCWNRKVQTGC